MNEQDGSSEEFDERKDRELKLTHALKQLESKDVIAKIRKLFNLENQFAVSICFPVLSLEQDILHFIIHDEKVTIYDAASITTQIQYELGYDETRGVNVQLQKRYTHATFNEIFLDVTPFSEGNSEGVVSFLKKHYKRYFEEEKKSLSKSQEMELLGVFKSPAMGSPRSIGKEMKEPSPTGSPPRVNVVEHQEVGGDTTFKMEVVVKVSGKVEPREMEERMLSLLESPWPASKVNKAPSSTSK